LTVTGEAADLHFLADLERPDDQQHHTRREIGQGSLQSETDREARRADHGDEARRLNTEARQNREYRDDEDQIAGDAGEEGLQHRVELRRAAEDSRDDQIGFTGEPKTDEQDDDAAQGIQAVRDDPRNEVSHVEQRGSRSLIQHRCSEASSQMASRRPRKPAATGRLGRWLSGKSLARAFGASAPPFQSFRA
jgi:hypothetical protein